MLVIMILSPILTLILVIVLLVKVSNLQRTVDTMSGGAQKQDAVITPELIEELMQLKSTGEEAAAVTKLKGLGFTQSQSRAFFAIVDDGSGDGLTPELVKELQYLKNADLTVTAESKLKALGLDFVQTHALLAKL